MKHAETTRGDYHNEARHARSASLPILVFQGKKSSSYRIAYEGRVPRITFSACVYVCVSQHFSRPRLSTALNVHGTKANPDGSCARTNDSRFFTSWFRYELLSSSRQVQQRVFSPAPKTGFLYTFFKFLKHHNKTALFLFEKTISPSEPNVSVCLPTLPFGLVSLRHAPNIWPGPPYGWGGREALLWIPGRCLEYVPPMLDVFRFS